MSLMRPTISPARPMPTIPPATEEEGLGPRPPRSQMICRQGSGLWNEDRALTCDNLFAVFDGASSLDRRLHAGRSGAWWAAEIAAREFAAGGAPLAELTERANRRLQRAMDESGVDLDDPLCRWSCSMAAFRLHRDFVEWVQVGDATVLVIDREGSWRLPAPACNQDRETLVLWKEMAERGAEDIFSALRPQIEKVRRGMNRDYGVLNGDPGMRHFMSGGRISLDNISTVMVYSDGLLAARENPEEGPDIDRLVAGFQKGGLEGVYRDVRSHERKDPGCRLFPRFKKHDDASGVAVSLLEDAAVNRLDA